MKLINDIEWESGRKGDKNPTVPVVFGIADLLRFYILSEKISVICGILFNY
jgi:hypothetical protein